MEKWVQIFKCITSHSSAKSLLPPLHKFTIRNLDLFFPFFGKLNLLNSTVFTGLSIFREVGKRLAPSESRIAFYQLFIVRVQKVSHERKVRGGLLGCFFRCILECLRSYVPTTSFRPMALRNKLECQCYNETSIPTC